MPSILSYPHVVEKLSMKAFLTILHAKKKFLKKKLCIGRAHSPYESSSVGGPFALPFFYTFN
jgi:hypothetical protein